MRADHAVRHNAAVGVLLGLAVGDVLSQLDRVPPVVCAGQVDLPHWGEVAEQSFIAAERFLNRELLGMTISATDIAASAIALADPDASPPLLADADAALMCAAVRSGMLGELDLESLAGDGSMMKQALRAAGDASTFAQAITGAPAEAMALTGAVAGLRWGPGAMPAAWVTLVTGPVGDRTYGLRQLRRLAERLMQQDAPVPPEPRRSLGPREVAPKLWLSNLHAVPKFLAQHANGAVLSLCPTIGTFDHHRPRREFALHDDGGRKVNPHLSATLDDVLLTIAAFHNEGREVLVHCHHGASRTGLVLRAWLVEELGLSADDATTEAQVRWSKTSTWNRAFSAEIARRAALKRERPAID